MKQRLPLIISATALFVALLGSTPLGRAAESAIAQVVPSAKVADFAKNAGKLNGHASSVNPKPGQIPVVGSNGKLPRSVGAVGPAGPTGLSGPQGPPGLSGYQRIQENVTAPSGNDELKTYGVSCPGGKLVLAGGYSFSKAGDVNDLSVVESRPSSDSVWQLKISNTTGQKPQGIITLYAVCANVSS